MVCDPGQDIVGEPAAPAGQGLDAAVIFRLLQQVLPALLTLGLQIVQVIHGLPHVVHKFGVGASETRARAISGVWAFTASCELL